MKILKNILLFTLLTSFMLVSCNQNDFNAPEFSEPKYTGKPANTTIKALKETYKEAITGVPVLINEDIIIKAVVTANDKTGNIYQKMIIQDYTGALELPILQQNLSNKYKVGQIVYLNCKGLCIGTYKGQTQPQIGELNNNEVSRMIQKKLEDHMSLDGFANDENNILQLKSNPSNSEEINKENELIKIRAEKENLPLIKDITDASIILNTKNSNDLLGTLIRLDGIYFEDGGKYDENDSPIVFAKDGSIQNKLKNIILKTGEKVLLLTSNYATFAKTKLPNRKGDMIAIYTVYVKTPEIKTPQLVLRSTDDLIGFNWE